MKKKFRKIILSYLLKDGTKVNKKVEGYAENAMEINEQLLMQIINDNRDTEYGRKYHFEDIKSISDYKRLVPTTTYCDYKDYISRMVNDNEKNLITTYPILHYNLSSGTTSDKKIIPYTKQAIRIYEEYGGFANVLAKIHNRNSPQNLSLPIMSCLTSNVSKLKNGITCGGLSEKILTQHKNIIRLCSVSPKEVLFPTEEMEVLYLQARFALVEPDISYWFLTFCTQLLQLIRYIEENQEILLKDIKEGVIDPSIKISDNMREKLMKRITPDPKRAKELRHAFKKGFKGVIPRIWKSMYSIDAISGGGFTNYRLELRYYLGDAIKINMYGYMASEGIFALCQEFDNEAALIVPDSCFFEFLPLGEEDLTKTLTLAEIQVGQEYEMIITNLSGFYRYRMNDIIKVADRYKNAPRIHFQRRTNQWINVFGEKVDEDMLWKVLGKLGEKIGNKVVDYVVYPDTKETPVRYKFYIELEKNRKEDIKVVASILQECLEEECSVLALFRERKMLADSEVNLLEAGTFADFRAMMQKKNHNQFKPVHIVENEEAIVFIKQQKKHVG